MGEFTHLELAVFAALSAPYDEVGGAGLATILASARVSGRDPISHGFFTNFTVDRKLAPLALRGGVLHGPDLAVRLGAQLMQMGFVLWIDEAGYPDCLEGFRYETPSGRPCDLEDADLAALLPLGVRAFRTA
jgi:hypothetical protein